jgi:hypothetical protein
MDLKLPFVPEPEIDSQPTTEREDQGDIDLEEEIARQFLKV